MKINDRLIIDECGKLINRLRGLTGWMKISISISQRRLVIILKDDECRGENDGYNTSRIEISWEEIMSGEWQTKIDEELNRRDGLL